MYFHQNEDGKPIQENILLKFIASKNICDHLDDQRLGQIASDVIRDYELDENTPEREEKREKWKEGRKIVKQTIEQKTRPFIGKAANFKHPLLSTAAIQYNSHTYPQVYNQGDPVKAKIIGRDPDGRKMESVKPQIDVMNYQLSEEIVEWRTQTDRLILMHSLYGVIYRKIYYSPLKRRICTKLLTPEQLVLPKGSEGTHGSHRISEPIYMWPNDIESYIRMGLYKKFVYSENGSMVNSEDCIGSEGQEEFIEQHRFIDLDNDGYQEPYIVTLHKASGTVCRILANYSAEDIVFSEIHQNKVTSIQAKEHYVDYPFIPDFDNSGQPTGFLDLLYPVNEAANSITNMMLDAGKLANSNSGFIGRDAKIGKGPLKVEVGKFTTVNALGGDVRKALVPLEFPGPNPGLFQLLGLMLEAGKEIGNIRDVLTGASNLSTMQPGTMMALVEQGTKIYSAIFSRLYESLKREFKILKRLNSKYLDEQIYSEILDVQVTKESFADKKYNFCPVANPKEAAEAIKIAKAAYLGQFIGDPFFNQMEIRKRMLDAGGIEGKEELLIQPSAEPSMEDRFMLSQMKVQELKLQLDIMREEKKAEEIDSKVVKNKASAIKDLADAESQEVGSQLDIYNSKLEEIRADGDTGRVQRMAATPSN